MRCVCAPCRFTEADVSQDGKLQPGELLALLEKASPAGYVVSDEDVRHVLQEAMADANADVERGQVRMCVCAVWHAAGAGACRLLRAGRAACHSAYLRGG
jgi:hypothetical protein